MDKVINYQSSTGDVRGFLNHQQQPKSRVSILRTAPMCFFLHFLMMTLTHVHQSLVSWRVNLSTLFTCYVVGVYTIAKSDKHWKKSWKIQNATHNIYSTYCCHSLSLIFTTSPLVKPFSMSIWGWSLIAPTSSCVDCCKLQRCDPKAKVFYIQRVVEMASRYGKFERFALNILHKRSGPLLKAKVLQFLSPQLLLFWSADFLLSNIWIPRYLVATVCFVKDGSFVNWMES